MFITYRVGLIGCIVGTRYLCRLRDRVRKVEGQAETTMSRVRHGSVYFYVHIILHGDALCIIYLRG